MVKRHRSNFNHVQLKKTTYRPVVALVGLDGDGGALAVDEIIGVVDVREAAGSNDGVDMSADLEVAKNSPSAHHSARGLSAASTHRARVDDGVDALRDDGPASAKDPVLRVCDCGEGGER